MSLEDFEDWRPASRTFAGMTLVQTGTMIISADDRLPESYPGGFISANAFDVIGVKPVLGRGFVPQDDAGRRAAGRVDQRRCLEIALRVRSRA